jgi:hypothetical protein
MWVSYKKEISRMIFTSYKGGYITMEDNKAFSSVFDDALKSDQDFDAMFSAEEDDDMIDMLLSGVKEDGAELPDAEELHNTIDDMGVKDFKDASFGPGNDTKNQPDCDPAKEEIDITDDFAFDCCPTKGVADATQKKAPDEEDIEGEADKATDKFDEAFSSMMSDIGNTTDKASCDDGSCESPEDDGEEGDSDSDDLTKDIGTDDSEDVEDDTEDDDEDVEDDDEDDSDDEDDEDDLTSDIGSEDECGSSCKESDEDFEDDGTDPGDQDTSTDESAEDLTSDIGKGVKVDTLDIEDENGLNDELEIEAGLGIGIDLEAPELGTNINKSKSKRAYMGSKVTPETDQSDEFTDNVEDLVYDLESAKDEDSETDERIEDDAIDSANSDEELSEDELKYLDSDDDDDLIDQVAGGK